MVQSPESQIVRRQRVNGAFLGQFHGQNVCLLGTILKADGGSAFQVRSSDGAQINIRLKTPINEPLTGLVEVYGMGQGKNLILADGYTVFPEEVAGRFDMAAYNEFVKLVNTLDGPENRWKIRDA